MLAKISIIALCALTATSSHVHSSHSHHHSSSNDRNTTNPLPHTPSNFEAFAKAYIWNEYNLTDTGYWGEIKFSSDLNIIYDG